MAGPSGETCATLENLFLDKSLLVRNDVVKMIQDSDFYIKRLPKEPWLDGAGYTYTYPIYERSIMDDNVNAAGFFQSFATLSSQSTFGDNNLAGTGACGITANHNISSFGVTTLSVTLNKCAVNSPDICLDDLRFQWQVMDQVKNVTRVLAENSKWVWSNTYQNEYMNAVSNYITANAAFTIATLATMNANQPPTSALTFGILEDIHQQLQYNGGSIRPTAVVEDGSPVYTAVGSTYTFNNLKKQDSNNRNDFQYASVIDDKGILVSKIGLGGKVYHGYIFAAVQFPPHFDIVTGAYVRRYPYIAHAATRGNKWDIDPNYTNAAYEDTLIYHDDVLRVLIPKPQGNFGNMTYEPEYSWAGEFVWRNIPDRQCNIDRNIGFFRALFAYGIKLERIDLAFAVRHLRCPNTGRLTTACAGS